MALDEQDRADFIGNLRDMADWLKTYPDVPVYGWISISGGRVHTKEEMIEIAKNAGDIDKEFYGNSLELRKSFGDRGAKVSYYVTIDREEVCEKKVVGTKMVKKAVYESEPTYVEVEEEDIEWECTPLLKPKGE